MSRFINNRGSRDLNNTTNILNDTLNASSIINDMSFTKPRLNIKNTMNTSLNNTMNTSLNTPLNKPRIQSNSPGQNPVVIPKEPFMPKPQNSA